MFLFSVFFPNLFKKKEHTQIKLPNTSLCSARSTLHTRTRTQANKQQAKIRRKVKWKKEKKTFSNANHNNELKICGSCRCHITYATLLCAYASHSYVRMGLVGYCLWIGCVCVRTHVHETQNGVVIPLIT